MATIVAEALALLQRGDSASAHGLVDAACARGDGDALAMRALWRVEGRWLPRDLAAARVDLAKNFQKPVGGGRIEAHLQ